MSKQDARNRILNLYVQIRAKGLTPDQLKKINFSKMDLSEICDDIPKKLPEDINERLQAFQSRLIDDIEKAEYKQ